MAPYCDISHPSEHPNFPEYQAWSEREHRWVILAFFDYQAWLTRPDLDPADFADREVAS